MMVVADGHKCAECGMWQSRQLDGVNQLCGHRAALVPITGVVDVLYFVAAVAAVALLLCRLGVL